MRQKFGSKLALPGEVTSWNYSYKEGRIHFLGKMTPCGPLKSPCGPLTIYSLFI